MQDESYGDEDADQVPTGTAEQESNQETPQAEATEDNMLSELQDLGGGMSMMGGESNAQAEYVEPSQHDMRRVKNIADEMATKLEKKQEE